MTTISGSSFKYKCLVHKALLAVLIMTVLGTASFTGCRPAEPRFNNASVGSFVPGEVIIGYADSGMSTELSELITGLRGEVIKEDIAGSFILVRVEEGSEEIFIRLILEKAGNMVKYAELNYVAEARIK